MNLFITLVMKDLGVVKNKRWNNSFWNKVYWIIALICGFVLYTVLVMRGKITPAFVNVVPVILLYASFPISISVIKREWRDNTALWWLQLPYSRRMLLGAKFTAALFRFLRTELIALLISAVVWGEGMILQPDIWKMNSLSAALAGLGKIYLQVILISPLFIAYGMLVVILMRTALKPAAPLFWIFYGVMISFFFSTFFNVLLKGGAGSLGAFAILGLSAQATVFLGIVISLMAAFLIFLFAAFILEKYVEV